MPNLSTFWTILLLIGMNLNKRELNEHVEFESQTYYAAFAAELEACAQPMWGLLTHCKVKVSTVSADIISVHGCRCAVVNGYCACEIVLKQETQEYTKTVVRYCLETLQIWFDAIGFIDEVTLNLCFFRKVFLTCCSYSVFHSLLQIRSHFTCHCTATMPCSSVR